MADDRRLVEFDRLNWLGKTLYVAGAAARLTAGAIDFTFNKAVDLAVEAEKAFRDGMNPHYEDARILEEHEHPSRTNKGGPGAGEARPPDTAL